MMAFFQKGCLDIMIMTVAPLEEDTQHRRVLHEFQVLCTRRSPAFDNKSDRNMTLSEISFRFKTLNHHRHYQHHHHHQDHDDHDEG